MNGTAAALTITRGAHDGKHGYHLIASNAVTEFHPFQGMDHQLEAFAGLVQGAKGSDGSDSPSLRDLNLPEEALADLTAVCSLLRSSTQGGSAVQVAL